MFSENIKKSISLVEILAILLFIVALIFIFISNRNNDKQDQEFRNAVRFQNVSELADTLWKVSLVSTEYSNFIIDQPRDVSCEDSVLNINDFSRFLVPEYFEVLPQDPNGQSYKVSLNEKDYITVCSPWGEREDGQVRVISITR